MTRFVRTWLVMAGVAHALELVLGSGSPVSGIAAAIRWLRPRLGAAVQRRVCRPVERALAG